MTCKRLFSVISTLFLINASQPSIHNSEVYLTCDGRTNLITPVNIHRDLQIKNHSIFVYRENSNSYENFVSDQLCEDSKERYICISKRINNNRFYQISISRISGSYDISGGSIEPYDANMYEEGKCTTSAKVLKKVDSLF